MEVFAWRNKLDAPRWWPRGEPLFDYSGSTAHLAPPHLTESPLIHFWTADENELSCLGQSSWKACGLESGRSDGDGGWNGAEVGGEQVQTIRSFSCLLAANC